jgi:uncharacterized NAD-dependent epimerase/dehydratase family protein
VKCDFGSTLLQYAANVVHAETDTDIFLGHRTTRQVEGLRPNWTTELTRVIAVARELGEQDCAVILSGPKCMAEEVRSAIVNLSKKHAGMHMCFTKETF